MWLTNAEEADLLMRYDPYLQKLVSGYLSKVKLPTSGQREDLLQEARIALLEHIRRMDNMDQICLCYIHVISAMCRHKERMALLHIPHRKFKEQQQKYTRVSADLLEYMPAMEDDADFEILLGEFLDSLDPSERTAFTMKADGHSNREIMRAIGLKSDYQISRYLKRLAGKYKRFTEAGEEDSS